MKPWQITFVFLSIHTFAVDDIQRTIPTLRANVLECILGYINNKIIWHFDCAKMIQLEFSDDRFCTDNPTPYRLAAPTQTPAAHHLPPTDSSLLQLQRVLYVLDQNNKFTTKHHILTKSEIVGGQYGRKKISPRVCRWLF